MTRRALARALVTLLAPTPLRAQTPKAAPYPLDGPPLVTAKAWVVADGKTGKVLVQPTDPFGDPNFSAGGYVTAGDIAGTGRAAWAVTPSLTGGPRVVIFQLLADGTFDARFSARARRYRYTIVNRPVPDPFLARTAWHVGVPLDLRAMTLACDPLIGEHDFSSFCRRPKTVSGEPASLVRRVVDARWEDDGDGVLQFWIEANAFCHQMVRSLVGTLVAVGEGRMSADEMPAVLASVIAFWAATHRAVSAECSSSSQR